MEYPVGYMLEDEEEELNQHVLVALLDDVRRLVDRMVDSVYRLREMVLRMPHVLGCFSRGQAIPQERVELPGAAIDSTFPPEGGIELVGGVLVGIVAGYTVFGGALRRDVPARMVYGRLLLVSSEEERQAVPYYAKMLEKKVARRLIKWVVEGKLGIKILLVDGELVPYKLVYLGWQATRKSSLMARLDKYSYRLLEEAKRAKVTLIGIVKRSYSRLATAVAGSEIPVNDKALATLLLPRGYYTVLGSYSSLVPRYIKYRMGEKAAEQATKWLEARKEYGRIVVGFYKPATGGSQAVKFEILDYAGLGLNKIVALLNTLTNPATGLPYPIDIIDEYTRFEARILELVRRRAVRLLAENVEPQLLSLLAHTNPEKRYLYEPRRTRAFQQP